MVIEYARCNARIDLKSRRPFHGIAMRLFVSARTDMCLPDYESICNACLMSCLKWRNNTEFISMLNRLEEETNESIIDTDDNVRLCGHAVVVTYRIFFSMMTRLVNL